VARSVITKHHEVTRRPQAGALDGDLGRLKTLRVLVASHPEAAFAVQPEEEGEGKARRIPEP
jgi:hypothetical protein